MSMVVKEIEFQFENCECFSVKRNVIGQFIMTDISDYISRIGCNVICRQEVAKTIAIELFKEGDEVYPSFAQDSDPITKFDRIRRWNDITHIYVTFENDVTEAYEVAYEEGEAAGVLGADNINQKTYISELGNLYIVIAAGKEVSDFFDMELVNDEETVSFNKHMMSIGVEEEPEHPYSPDSLPEKYRYVYLYEDNEASCLAIRVDDENAGWRFVYESDPVHFPKKWKYPNSDIVEFLDVCDSNFSVSKVKELYPPLG